MHWKWLLGFNSLKCVEGQCKKFSSKKPSEIPNLKDEVLCYNQFLVMINLYTSKKKNKKKKPKQTDRNCKKIKTVRDELLKESWKCLKHRFQVET